VLGRVAPTIPCVLLPTAPVVVPADKLQPEGPCPGLAILESHKGISLWGTQLAVDPASGEAAPGARAARPDGLPEYAAELAAPASDWLPAFRTAAATTGAAVARSLLTAEQAGLLAAAAAVAEAAALPRPGLCASDAAVACDNAAAGACCGCSDPAVACWLGSSGSGPSRGIGSTCGPRRRLLLMARAPLLLLLRAPLPMLLPLLLLLVWPQECAAPDAAPAPAAPVCPVNACCAVLLPVAAANALLLMLWDCITNRPARLVPLADRCCCCCWGCWDCSCGPTATDGVTTSMPRPAWPQLRRVKLGVAGPSDDEPAAAALTPGTIDAAADCSVGVLVARDPEVCISPVSWA